MKPTHTRTMLWIFAALAALTIAVGLYEAGRTSDQIPVLVATTLVELALGVASYIAYATRSRAPAAHTRGRWSILDATRTLVIALVFGFLTGLLVATFLDVQLANPWFILGLLAPASAGALSLVGAILEQERFLHVRRTTIGDEDRARKVYETRTGAVLVEEHDGRKEVILTGPKGRRDVNAVEREIDQRGWREGERPINTELNDALQRWGVLRGKTE